MDGARQTVPKARKKDKGRSTEQRFSFRLVHIVAGVALLEAGLCKLVEFAWETSDQLATQRLLTVTFVAEIVGGVALMAGVAPAVAHRAAFAAFTGFTVAHIYQLMSGAWCCGCFGGLFVNPWLVLMFDIAALLALMSCHQPEGTELMGLLRSLRSPMFAVIVIVAALASWKQGTLVRLEGRATFDGRPLASRDLVFTGESGKFQLRTDGDGCFHLPLVRPGPYTVAASWGKREKNSIGEHTVQWIEASNCSGFLDVDLAPKELRAAAP